MNINYSQFYKGSTSLPTYGNGPYGKDTLAKYEFNTTDENGSKVMDKMTKKETLQTMKDIRSQYGDNVIIEFSGDGMAALVDDKNGTANDTMTPAQQEAMKKKNEAFQKEIKPCNVTVYSGMYRADNAAASPVKNYSQEEQGSVNKFIRQNFLVENNSSITDAEQPTNIPLSMKKAEYMEYGAVKGKYLANDSFFSKNANVIDNMRIMDRDAYSKYKKMNTIFAGIKRENKLSFTDSLKSISKSNSNFISSARNRELSNKFWMI